MTEPTEPLLDRVEQAIKKGTHDWREPVGYYSRRHLAQMAMSVVGPELDRLRQDAKDGLKAAADASHQGLVWLRERDEARAELAAARALLGEVTLALMPLRSGTENVLETAQKAIEMRAELARAERWMRYIASLNEPHRLEERRRLDLNLLIDQAGVWLAQQLRPADLENPVEGVAELRAERDRLRSALAGAVKLPALIEILRRDLAAVELDERPSSVPARRSGYVSGMQRCIALLEEALPAEDTQPPMVEDISPADAARRVRESGTCGGCETDGAKCSDCPAAEDTQPEPAERVDAISAATQELRELGRLGPTEAPADDVIRLHAGDEDIIVAFEREGA